MARKYDLTEDQAVLVFNTVKSHCEALKNWIVSKVEDEDFNKASELVVELRNYQRIYAILNVETHKFTEEYTLRHALEMNKKNIQNRS